MQLKRTKEIKELSTSSMADIAFLLIIFFMVSAIFSYNKGLFTKQPNKNKKPKLVPQKNILEIYITKNEKITINHKYIDISSIKNIIQNKVRKNKNLIVQIYTHPQARYEIFTRVLSIIQENKNIKIAIGIKE